MSENSKENLKEKFKKIALAVTLTGAATALNAKEAQNEMSSDASIEPTEVNAPNPAENPADSQTSMEFYSASEYPDRLTEFCRNNNIHDIHTAPYEYQRKLNHRVYSGIYIGYKNKTEWRYGQQYNKSEPIVIVVPHDPYKDVLSMSYRFTKESFENNTHIFDQTERLQEEYRINEFFKERVERFEYYKERSRRHEQFHPRERKPIHRVRPQRNYSENSENKSNSYSESRARLKESLKKKNNTERPYRPSRNFGR